MILLRVLAFLLFFRLLQRLSRLSGGPSEVYKLSRLRALLLVHFPYLIEYMILVDALVQVLLS
jgi:hypothetical protein